LGVKREFQIAFFELSINKKTVETGAPVVSYERLAGWWFHEKKPSSHYVHP